MPCINMIIWSHDTSVYTNYVKSFQIRGHVRTQLILRTYDTTYCMSLRDLLFLWLIFSYIPNPKVLMVSCNRWMTYVIIRVFFPRRYTNAGSHHTNFMCVPGVLPSSPSAARTFRATLRPKQLDLVARGCVRLECIDNRGMAGVVIILGKSCMT